MWPCATRLLTDDIFFATPQAKELVMKMLTADPPIAFRRIIDKKTGKPRLAVTRENIVDEVRPTSSPSARVPFRVRQPSL